MPSERECNVCGHPVVAHDPDTGDCELCPQGSACVPPKEVEQDAL